MQDAIQLFGVGADDYIYILHSVSPFVITISGISNLSINSMANQNSFPYRFWSSTESWRVSRVNDKPLVIHCCYVYYIWLNSQHPRRRVSVLLIMYACVRASACVSETPQVRHTWQSLCVSLSSFACIFGVLLMTFRIIQTCANPKHMCIHKKCYIEIIFWKTFFGCLMLQIDAKWDTECIVFANTGPIFRRPQS